MLDKAFGIQAILDWFAAADAERTADQPALPLLFGEFRSREAEALRFLQAGARGIFAKPAGLAFFSLVSALAPWGGVGWKTACSAIPAVATVILAVS